MGKQFPHNYSLSPFCLLCQSCVFLSILFIQILRLCPVTEFLHTHFLWKYFLYYYAYRKYNSSGTNNNINENIITSNHFILVRIRHECTLDGMLVCDGPFQACTHTPLPHSRSIYDTSVICWLMSVYFSITWILKLII